MAVIEGPTVRWDHTDGRWRVGPVPASYGRGKWGQDADPHATRIPSARAGTTVSAVAAMLSEAVNACQRGAGLGLTATETMRPCGDGVCLGRVGAVGAGSAGRLQTASLAWQCLPDIIDPRGPKGGRR